MKQSDATSELDAWATYLATRAKALKKASRINSGFGKGSAFDIGYNAGQEREVESAQAYLDETRRTRATRKSASLPRATRL